MIPKKRILVADDDRGLAMAISIRLQGAGYEVLIANDAYNALATAARDKPDLMLLDVHMPAGEGFSVQSRLEQLPSSERPHVLYMTGDHSGEIEVKAAIAGALGVLHKPMKHRELLDVIERVLMPKAA